MFFCPSQHQNSPTHVLPFFSPWFHWSELEMRRQQSTKPSNVWFFFFQKISRSNLWLTDPWQLQISLFLSLLALHLVEKLSDSHLHQAAQVFIMCMHTEYPIWCTPQRLQALCTHGADRVHAAIYPVAFLVFIAQNPPHLLFFLRRCLHSERDASVVLVLGHIGVNVHTFPSCFLPFKTTQFAVKITRNQLPLSGQMDGKHLHLRHCAATNAETMWLR